jgi:hypothetical protein
MCLFFYLMIISPYCRHVTSMEIISKDVTLSIETPAQKTFFADETFENRLRTYFNGAHNVTMNIGHTTGNSTSRMIRIIGEQNSIDKASEELSNLLLLMHTITFDKITGQKSFFCFMRLL